MVRDAVKLKKDSYQARYQYTKWSEVMVVAETIENSFMRPWKMMALKRFWTTILHLRRGKNCTVSTVYSEDGVLLTLTQNIVDWWKEY